MKNELYHYLVIPSVYRVGAPTDIVIRPLESKYNIAESDNRIVILPISALHESDGRLPFDTVTGTVVNGELHFSYTFPVEDEYAMLPLSGEDAIEVLDVYALNDDLYELRPLKGDTHVHSCRSDGHETPAIVAANYRAAGFDFMALTDHKRFAPSAEAIEAYRGVRLGMTQMHGEEVHSPGNYVHIVHFGGNYSVNKIFLEDEEKFRREVAEIEREMGDEIPFVNENDRYIYASTVWCVREIRKAGGIAIYPHPFWLMRNRSVYYAPTYNVPTEMTRQFILNDVFDAFELIGGQSAHENNYQTQFYYSLKDEYIEKNGKPLTVPVLGASDSHGTVNTGWFNRKFSVVFAKSRKPEDILGAIMDKKSVAVEVYEDSENYSVHGQYRLMAYARFLCENYFPLTQKLCAVDGALMQEYIMGSADAGKLLDARADVTDNFYKLYFGK